MTWSHVNSSEEPRRPKGWTLGTRGLVHLFHQGASRYPRTSICLRRSDGTPTGGRAATPCLPLRPRVRHPPPRARRAGDRPWAQSRFARASGPPGDHRVDPVVVRSLAIRGPPQPCIRIVLQETEHCAERAQRPAEEPRAIRIRRPDTVDLVRDVEEHRDRFGRVEVVVHRGAKSREPVRVGRHGRCTEPAKARCTGAGPRHRPCWR